MNESISNSSMHYDNSSNTNNYTNISNSVTEEPIINLPQFQYHSIDIEGFIQGYYYFFINGIMINFVNSFQYNIENITIKVLEIISYAKCYAIEIQSPDQSYNFRFRCSFIPPPQFFNSIEIYEPLKIGGFIISNWPTQKITKNKEMVCSDYKFSVKNYYDVGTYDMYSDTFYFEIEMETSIKEGTIKDKTILLNVTIPSSIVIATCQLSNTILNSFIKLHCQINDLSQERRIVNGIKIVGIIKNNITDEYLITNNNVYIKLIDFKEIELTNVECPKEFIIDHCKTVNKYQKKCEKCNSNYYLRNNNECLTCSQLNEGCSSCNKNGECTKCLTEFQLSGNSCQKKVTCQTGTFGPKCKKCEDINLNCNECNKSGYCKKCKKGYYLTGIDSNSKCVKCISTCEECDSLNRCTKCSEGLVLNVNDYSCVSCFSLNEGCQECSKNGKCTKCYNDNNFKYRIEGDKCVKKEEKKETSKTNLQFERLDGFEQEDDKVHFKSHFILFDNILYNSVFHITIIIQVKIIIIQDYRMYRLRYLRGLQESERIESIEKDITCSQYGDSFGSQNKGGYLANFKCTTDLDENQELLSIEPTNMEIKDKDNQVIQNFETEKVVLDVNELDKISMDEEYENYLFNKISISNISDVTIKDNELSFNIIGNIDSSIEKGKEYEISLKDSNNKIVISTCYFPALKNLNNQVISCKVSINQESKVSDLSFVQGVYCSKTRNDDKMILVDNNSLNIKVPENSKLSTLTIIFISVGAVVVVSIISVFLIIKCKVFKKENKIKKEKEKESETQNNLKRSKNKSERMTLRSNRHHDRFHLNH
jgi:uncharacterized membrane protein YciS (DUF1049 family)